MKKFFVTLLLFAFVVSGFLKAQNVNKQDSLALVALYNATDGINWKNNTNWLTSNWEAQYSNKWWYGVTVNDEGRVTMLNLPDNWLTGELPPEFFTLTELQTLNLYDNQISGNLPAEISGLSSLTNLSVGANQMTGQLPPEIGDLNQLTILSINKNNFEGAVPQEVLGLTKLKIFNIAFNRFTDLPDLSSLFNLENLYVSWNAFTFDDILPIADFSGFFDYSNQQRVENTEYYTLTDGETIMLSTNITNSGNTYQWYKNNRTISGATSATYEIASFSAADEGYYYCRIENPAADYAGFALQTKNIYVSAQPFFDTQFQVTHNGQALKYATIVIGNSIYETNENGIVNLKFTDGSYDYTVSAFDKQDYTGTATVNGATQTIDIEMLPQLYDLNWQITNGAGNVPNAIVDIDGALNTASQFGALTVSLTNGIHSFNISAANHISENGSFFQPTETFNKSIVLTPLFKVEFTVTDGSNPLPNATVLVHKKEITTNAEGKAEFWLPDGTYQYAVEAATFGNEGGSVNVNGSPENVSATLSPGYETTFTVSNDATGIANAAIEIGGFTYPCNENGEKNIMLKNGIYTYNILVGDVVNKKGELQVNNAANSVDIILPFSIVKENKTATTAALSRKTYYDTDNDGILEMFKNTYVSTSERNIRRYPDFLQSNNGEVKCAFMNSWYRSFEIMNVNNDANPDFYVLYGGGNAPRSFLSKPDGAYEQELYNADKRPDIDVDLDGLPDQIYSDGDQLSFYRQTPENGYVSKKFALKQIEDLENEYDYSAWEEPKVIHSYYTSGLPGGFYPIGFTYPPANTSQQKLIDYNQDGLPDILDEKGILFRNMGDDTFLEVPFYGKVIARDLNGDFLTDFIATKNDSVMALIYEGKGKYRKQNLITSMAVDDEIYIRDFDKDNDADVLLPFSFDKNETATFLVFFENDGNGNFTKHEKVFMKQWKILQCADVNHDGYYDFLVDKVILVGNEYQKANQTFMLMGKAGFEFDVFDNGGKIGDYLLDFDNDGYYEGITSGRNISYQGDTVYHFGGVAANTPPAKPAKPEIYVDRATGKLHINWKAATDAESSTCDLTYALRVGTAEGKGDILYANANENGTRRNKEDGNMGGNLSHVLNAINWHEGDYYISVQAVDPMHSGSAWSDYAIVKNDLLFARFDISDTAIAPNDELLVRFAGNPSDNYTFHWDFGTANVIENNDNQTVKLTFNSAGKHEISLYIENANGQKSDIFRKTVFVNPLKFTKDDLAHLAVADFDADGDIDLVTTDGLYENDGNGNFTKLATIFNLTFTPGFAYWDDADKDGDPDLLYSINDAADGQSGILINDGTGGFTETAKSFQAQFFSNFKADIDRDGNIDYFYRDKFYINNGDYTFTEKTLSANSLYYNFENVIDLNNDNYVDVWYERYGVLTFFINQKNGTFSEVTITLPDKYNNNTPIYAIRDFNNDNLPDVLVKKNSQAFHVFVNQENNTFGYGRDFIFDFSVGGQIETADIDNNGYIDLMVTDGLETHVLLMDKEFKIKTRFITTDDFRWTTNIKLIDLNNDNIADIINTGQSPAAMLMREGFSPNTAPAPPQDVIAYQTNNGIVIKWKHGSDNENPPHKLQYNLSIKDVNSGEYLFSPAVFDNDNVPPLLTRHYIKGNSITLNKQQIPTGEYEIKLQSIDTWGASSPFSATVNLNVTLSPAFDIPEFACAGSEVTVEYTGNTGANTTFAWNFDGAVIVSGSDAGPYTVKWENGGLKKVKIDVTTDGNTESFMSGIRISQIYTANITTAGEMVAGISGNITLPAIPENSSDLNWTITDGSVIHNDFAQTAQIMFNSAGEKTIAINWSENGCAAGNITKTITVHPPLPVPQIDVITTDHSTGGNIIRWTNNFAPHIEKILIFKEASLLNQFEKIAELDVNAVSEFIDIEANANRRAYRYRMAVKDQWGHIGKASPIHKTVHLKINKAMNGWNIFWNNYQGMAVAAYKIYRGTSPDNMTLLEQIPASLFSYTDVNPPSGTLYYSIEIVRQAKRGKRNENSQSNYISTEEAFEPIYVSTIDLFTSDGGETINEVSDSLVVMADILPANATLKSLTWQITSGSELATIDQNGTVKPIEGQTGTVEVTAISQDGSAVSATISLEVSTSVIPNNSPEISNVTSNPSPPTDNDAVNVSATVTDSDGTIASVVLNWGLNAGSLSNQIAMTNSTGDVYTTNSAIPAQSDGTTVYYQIVATDNDNDATTMSDLSYTVSNASLLTPPYSHGFDNNSFGDIQQINVTGAQEWYTDDFGVPAPGAKISGFNGNTSVANEDWLILPGFNFTSVNNPVLQFDEAANYAVSVENNLVVLISTDYSGSGDPNNATWVKLTVNNRASGSDWTFVTVSPIDISNWAGQAPVYIAFKYTSSTNGSATWELDNISITEQTTTNNSPEINNVVANPASPTESDAVNVSATVTDSDGTIASVVLKWGLSSGNLSNQISMTKGTGNVYTTSSAIPTQSGGNRVYYQITATDDDSEATNSAEMSYSVTTGIENEHINAKIALYPNPVKSTLNIEFEGSFSICIFDIHGRKVGEDINFGDKNSVDVSGLTSGVYLLKLKSAEGVVVKRFVKE